MITTYRFRVGVASLFVVASLFACRGRLDDASRAPNTSSQGGAGGGSTPNAEVLLYGGHMPTSYAGTWHWSAGQWTRTGLNPPEVVAASESVDETTTALVAVNGIPILLGLGGAAAMPNASSVMSWWSWDDNEDWSGEKPTSIPMRTSFAATSWNGQVAVFGGRSMINPGEDLDDFWTWDGQTWTEQAKGPPARSYAALSPFGSSLVLFGGRDDPSGDGGAGFADTWRWDGTWWMQVLAAGPGKCIAAVMAPLGDRVILFGGELDTGELLDETWSFDGANWTKLDVKGPPARKAAAMAPVDGKLLLFGGAGPGSVPLGDTWTFDGTKWAPASSTTNPPALIGASIVGYP